VCVCVYVCVCQCVPVCMCECYRESVCTGVFVCIHVCMHVRAVCVSKLMMFFYCKIIVRLEPCIWEGRFINKLYYYY